MKRRRNKLARIQAADAVANHVTVCAATGTADIVVEAGEDGAQKQPRFSMLAYAGGLMRPNTVPSLPHPLVVDLSTLTHAKAVPILRNHNMNELVGQTTKIDLKARSVSVEGVITGNLADGTPAGDIVSHSKRGFKWPVSVGVKGTYRLVDRGERVIVNGRAFDGPVYVISSGRLTEVSFVPLGADENAEASIAASAAEGQTMKTFEQWLKELSLEASALSDEQRTALQAKYDAEVKAAAGDDDDPGDEDDGQSATVHAAAAEKEALKGAAAGVKKAAALRKVCEGEDEILVKALEGDWSVDKAEAEVLRAKMSRINVTARRADKADGDTAVVVEAAIRLGSSEPTERVEADYEEKVLDRASKLRGLGMKGLVSLACQIDGRQCPGIHEGDSAFIQAAFSTNTMPNILAATANKTLLAAYATVPPVFRRVARKLSPNDFKTHTGYRANSDGGFEKVGEGQKIPFGHMKEEMSFSYRAETFAKLMGITLQQWRNDDLGAFTDVPRLAGRDAARKVEAVGWALHAASVSSGGFIDNSGSDANGNYMDGADTVLSIESLGEAEAKMLTQEDSNGHPILVEPKFLVVAPANKNLARRIYTSTRLVGGVDPLEGEDNVLAGMFEPLVSRDLTTAVQWALFSDPSVEAAYGVAYLDGVETPTVEEMPVSPEYLGRLWRAVLHFGVCTIEPAAIVYSKGAS
ncbi:MAG: HK97 family phage prohead protease [Phycisphaerales bacterium]|nr:HK97 family phage prohead protease [Phycisphaerales bacterium]